MIYGFVRFAMSDHQNVEFARPFEAKFLRDYASEEGGVVRKALDEEFQKRLKLVKDYVEEYVSGAASGDRRVETEATRTQPLQYAFINAEKLHWLMERMVEFRGAESAIRAWCKPDSFRINAQRMFRDEALRHSIPLLPRLIMLCTVELGKALVSGDVWARRQLKLDFVQEWLFVLITCKQYNRSVRPNLTRELEETLLKIISTLSLVDAQHWLQMCLSFSTHEIEVCPHLTTAFKSWFRRAKPQPPNSYL